MSVAETNLAVIDGYFAAMRSGGPAAALPFYAEDVVLEVPGHHAASGTYRGHDGIAAFGAAMAEASGGTFRLHPEDLIAGDGHVVTVATASVGPDEARVSWRRLVLSTVRNGKLATLRFFEDDQDVVDAALGGRIV